MAKIPLLGIIFLNKLLMIYARTIQNETQAETFDDVSTEGQKKEDGTSSMILSKDQESQDLQFAPITRFMSDIFSDALRATMKPLEQNQYPAQNFGSLGINYNANNRDLLHEINSFLKDDNVVGKYKRDTMDNRLIKHKTTLRISQNRFAQQEAGETCFLVRVISFLKTYFKPLCNLWNNLVNFDDENNKKNKDGLAGKQDEETA